MPEDAGPAAQLDLALRLDRVRLPRDLRPMLPVQADAAFDSADHLFDAAWGGMRVLAFVEGSAVTLVDEHGADVSDRYPAVTASLSTLGDAGLVLDGEIVERMGTPAALAPWPGAGAGLDRAHVLVAQDLLVLDGRSLLAEPLQRRRIALATAVTPRDAVVVAEPVPSDGIELLEAVAGLGLPGVIAKRRDSPYLPGVRSALWLRIEVPARPSDGFASGDMPASRDARASRFAPAPLRRALVVLRGLPFDEP